MTRRRSGAPDRRLKNPEPPLYSMIDATNALGRFGRMAEYQAPLQIAPGIRATYFDAGHILGSASILVEVQENGSTQTILFSGDIGNAGRPLLRPPQTPKEAQWVVMETTYGDRLHRDFRATVEEFQSVIAGAIQRGGNVVVPTFALERAQELLFFLREGIEQNEIPPSIAVYLDSPMAVSATEIFEHHPECYNETIAAMLRDHHDPFGVPGLKMVRQRIDSMAINEVSSGAIIMAGSGMATGGRIRHHLRHNLANPKSVVMFVGYAAAGTLARKIIDGAKHVNLMGHDVPVRAGIHTLNGFSAHADQRELLQWHERDCRPQRHVSGARRSRGDGEIRAACFPANAWKCRNPASHSSSISAPVISAACLGAAGIPAAPTTATAQRPEPRLVREPSWPRSAIRWCVRSWWWLDRRPPGTTASRCPHENISSCKSRSSNQARIPSR